MRLSTAANSRSKISSRLLLLGSISALSLWAPPALAQQSSTASAEDAANDDFGTITVTARRRDENLDKVPASIAAFSADQLAARSITTESDLQKAVPGLTIRESLSSNQLNYSLRGQSVDAYSSSSPGVLPYFNEFQVTTTSATSFIDLESVQVIKGPQGTLFGRNTTGGAVLYGTAKPTNTLSGSIKGRLGNFDMREGEVVLNLPVVDDKLLVRFAGSILRRDGYMYDDVNKIDLGRDSSQTGRVSVLLSPTESFENITMFQYNATNGTNSGSPIYNVYPTSITAITYSPAGLGAGCRRCNDQRLRQSARGVQQRRREQRRTHRTTRRRGLELGHRRELSRCTARLPRVPTAHQTPGRRRSYCEYLIDGWPAWGHGGRTQHTGGRPHIGFVHERRANRNLQLRGVLRRRHPAIAPAVAASSRTG